MDAQRTQKSSYGVEIFGPDGRVCVSGCDSPQDATMKVVDMAISSGWHPPRWWEYWLPKWYAEERAEYFRQTKGPNMDDYSKSNERATKEPRA